jgi:hypothetical protein
MARTALRAGQRASLRAGSYLTDGERLFRVVSRLSPPDGRGLAELEDCLTLEIWPYSADELWAMRLRAVPRDGRAED